MPATVLAPFGATKERNQALQPFVPTTREVFAVRESAISWRAAGSLQLAKGVATLDKVNPGLLHLQGQAVVLIQTDSAEKGKCGIRERTSSHSHPGYRSYIASPNDTWFQMPLFSSADSRHNAGGFARLDDHHYLVRLRLLKVRLDEVVAPTFGSSTISTPQF